MRLSDGRVRLGGLTYGIGAEIQDDADGAVWRLLHLLDGTRELGAVIADASREFGGASADSVRAALETLIASGFVEDAGAPAPVELSAPELDRYASNTRFFSWVDVEPRATPYDAQRRLKDARVAVLGLGGTGGAVAMSLTAAGVGSLLCVDSDAVEVSNLSRQLLFGQRDVGRPKVEAATARLRDLNPHVNVQARETRAGSPDDLTAIMREVDFLVVCADEPPLRLQLWANEAAMQTGTPWSVCQYDGPMIVTGMFVPFASACFECFLEFVRRDNARRDGPEPEPLFTGDPGNAVIAPSANASGHFAALEVIYYLSALRPQTVGRVLHHDLVHYDHAYYIEPPRLSHCPACGGNRGPGEIRQIPQVHD